MIASSPEVDSWISVLPEQQNSRIELLRGWVRKYADPLLEECVNYRMIAYVVPISTFPDGYHCSPGEPLPFLNIGAMKNHVGLYHMGLYADPTALDFFVAQYKEIMGKKPNMGKSCLRLSWKTEISEELIKAWCSSMDAHRWIELYKKSQNRE